MTFPPFNSPDKELHEECGVFGIYSSEDSTALTALGLHALQHRGQEAAGIVSVEKNKYFHKHTADGLVGDNFNSKRIINKLKGNKAIGHVRYSTAGKKNAHNYQPILAEMSFGGIAVAHNGNLTNANTLRKELISQGCIFSSTMDTEVIVHLIAKSKLKTTEDRIIDALKNVVGAYSLVTLTKNALIAVRDPHGIRPLVLGKLKDSYVVASETCALDIIGAKLVRDVKAGEMIIINKDGLTSLSPFEKKDQKFCIFEYIYFSRPDSLLDGKHVYDVRKKIGKQLAQENGVEADIIVPVPDSGVPSALGYAEEAGIAFEFGIIRNHYVGRTFIEPTNSVRHLGVKLKHNANNSLLKGKRVILVDDSIVRGTTSKKIVDMVRASGAKEVHMRIASPPTTNPCFYGVDTPDKKDLLAANHDIEEMRKLIGADSLAFISIDGLYKAVNGQKRNNKNPAYCDACFTGEYAINLVDQEQKILPLFKDNKIANNGG
jgi:amidophosphoribosyltransferase